MNEKKQKKKTYSRLRRKKKQHTKTKYCEIKKKEQNMKTQSRHPEKGKHCGLLKEVSNIDDSKDEVPIEKKSRERQVSTKIEEEKEG